MAKSSDRDGGDGAEKSAPLRTWESEYPRYPNLLEHEYLADCDAIFNEIRNWTKGTEPPSSAFELFDAAMLTRFIERTTAGEQVEPFIMRFLVSAFSKALLGAAWDEVIRLPGRELPNTWGQYAPLDQRDLQLYAAIKNKRSDGINVTTAIRETAGEHSVSFETARTAYYNWRTRLSKKAT